MDWTFTILAIQTVLIALFGFLASMCVIAIVLNGLPMIGAALGARRMSHPRELERFLWTLVWCGGVLAPLMGVWLTAGFSHLRLWNAWLGWAGVLLAVQAICALVIVLIGGQEEVFEMRLHQTDAITRARVATFIFLLPGSAVILAMMICATAGIPIGRVFLWLFAIGRRARWRWRRKQRRLARAA